MIKTKDDYKYYLKQDAKALRKINNSHPKIFGDDIWVYERLMRKCEYQRTFKGLRKFLYVIPIYFNKLRLNKMALKLGFSIPVGSFEAGLSIAHYGTIVVNSNARIGKNCRIHEGVNIGATNGDSKAPIIGDNVFIGTGAKIIGDIIIADDVAIGANAVVVKSITEPGTTWGVSLQKRLVITVHVQIYLPIYSMMI